MDTISLREQVAVRIQLPHKRQTMTLVDLSHTFTATMPVYLGDPAAELTQTASVEKDGCEKFRLHTDFHVGTHIDAPLHFIAGGKKISDYPVEKFIGRGVLIHVEGQNKIHADVLENVPLTTDSIVLFHTGWSKEFGKPAYYTDHPVLTEHLAERLVMAGVKAIGIDSPSPDKSPYPLHPILLGADVLILENLTNLDALPRTGAFEIMAFPPKFEAEASFVRVVAKVLT